MKYIKDFAEGIAINDVYLCSKKQLGTTKNGNPYESLTLLDKTGTVDAKIWSLTDPGIEEFEAPAFLWISGQVQSFNGSLQVKVSRVRIAQEGEYNPQDCLPATDRDVDEMYAELMRFVDSVEAPYMKKLLMSFFGDEDFAKRFKAHSAAKSVHHGFIGGLLEHTLSVTTDCDFFAKQYPFLNRDLLITAALFHDIGKMDELSTFPANDYTDDGQLVGHIMIGAMQVRDRIRTMEDFPEVRERELIHCILAHHGKLEFGSPKAPALAEAIALHFADNIDAKMETMKEAVANTRPGDLTWLGYNRFLDSNIRRTSAED